MTTTITETAMEARARRAARGIGLKARKSTWRKNSVDNHGGFRIIDPYRNTIEAGERYDLSAEEVINFCRQPG